MVDIVTLLTPLQTQSEQVCMEIKDVIVLATARSQVMDGIYDYTCQLAKSLGRYHNAEVHLLNPRHETLERLAGSTGSGARPKSVSLVLQYNPFSFGRWGFAPWLPVKLWQLRRRAAHVHLVLMVHEPYMPISDIRTAVMGLWQRLQLVALRGISQTVLMSIPAWSDSMRGWPRRPLHHLPVGSNLPDERSRRASVRKSLRADQETAVLAAFGSGHAARLIDYVSAAAQAVARSGVRTVLLNLGSGTPAISIDTDVEVIAPGPLDAVEVARYLSAADIFLAPLIDGVSSRRTTVMAALQHGLPVLGTQGPLTDCLLAKEGNGLMLTPVGDRERFAAAAVAMMADPWLRRRLATEARRLYEEEFAWDASAARLLGILRGQNSETGHDAK